MRRFALCLAAVACLGCAPSEAVLLRPLVAADTGQPAPSQAPLDLGLERMGRPRSAAANTDLGRELGELTVVEVWATWCAPCQETLPATQDLVASFGRADLRMLAVTLDKDTAAVQAFVTRHNIVAAVYTPRDPEEFRSRLLVERIPTTLLIGADGEVLRRFDGLGEGTLLALRAEIQARVKPRG